MYKGSDMLDELFAQAIGREALRYFKSAELMDKLVKDMEFDALAALAQIEMVLEDQTLDDPECFQRIEAIVQAFHWNGLGTSRHDWG